MSEKKVNNIFKLIGFFVDKKIICKNGNILNQQGIIVDRIENHGFKVRNFKRYLNDIAKLYPHIIKIQKTGSHCYKLESTSEIFHTFLSNSEEVSWLLQLIYESDKNLLNELAQETQDRLAKISKREKDIFLFEGLPFDELKNPKKKEIFNTLKVATKNNEYRDIQYHYNSPQIIKDAQCLKLIFMENNWYIATASKENGFLLLRMSFITHVDYAKKETYQPSQIKKYNEYFHTIQNPMTKFGVPKQKAHLLASQSIAKYFRPNMKKFLNSQTFVDQRDNGMIEFTLEYTHPLEILPFIKRWLPDIEILSPSSLQDTMVEDLKIYLQRGV